MNILPIGNMIGLYLSILRCILSFPIIEFFLNVNAFLKKLLIQSNLCHIDPLYIQNHTPCHMSRLFYYMYCYLNNFHCMFADSLVRMFLDGTLFEESIICQTCTSLIPIKTCNIVYIFWNSLYQLLIMDLLIKTYCVHNYGIY